MILGSGGIVHNLRELGNSKKNAPRYASFDSAIANWLDKRDFQSLANYAKHPEAKLCVPTPEHFLPLLVVAGASSEEDRIDTFTEGPSMRSLAFVS